MLIYWDFRKNKLVCVGFFIYTLKLSFYFPTYWLMTKKWYLPMMLHVCQWLVAFLNSNWHTQLISSRHLESLWYSSYSSSTFYYGYDYASCLWIKDCLIWHISYNNRKKLCWSQNILLSYMDLLPPLNFIQDNPSLSNQINSTCWNSLSASEHVHTILNYFFLILPSLGATTYCSCIVVWFYLFLS